MMSNQEKIISFLQQLVNLFHNNRVWLFLPPGNIRENAVTLMFRNTVKLNPVTKEFTVDEIKVIGIDMSPDQEKTRIQFFINGEIKWLENNNLR